MTNQKKEENKFDIFDDIKTYQGCEYKENIEVGLNDSIKSCDTTQWSNNGYNGKLSTLCKNFINLYYKLYPSELDNNGNTNNKHAEYLNFWFNNKLKTIPINSNEEQNIYSNLKNIYSTIDKNNRIKDKINKIQEDDYIKLNTLNNLYTNYIKLDTRVSDKSDEKDNFTGNAEKCIENFKDGIKLYLQKIDDDNFYKALHKFSVLYKIARYKLASIGKLEVDPLPVLEEEKAKKKLEDACNSIENILKDFTEYQKYDEFKKQTNDKNICVKYCDKIIHLEKKYKDIKIVSIKLAANLDSLSSMTKISADHSERCSYMNYWTYNIIMHTLSSISNNDEKIYLLKIINNLLFDINDKLTKEKKCIYYVNNDLDKWKEEKDLHDYFKNYSDIDKIASDNSKNTDYCDYIIYINSLYEKYVHSCCTYFFNNPYWNDCKAYFNCEEQYNPHNLYLKLNCQELSSDKFKTLKRVTTPVPIDYKFSPAGRRFSKKQPKNKQKITHNLNEPNRQTSPKKEVNYVNKSSKKERIRIAYQTT
ncbi:variable surface protein Vir5 [Plasmodium vivax Mauritania I]|uniref:Variable surface protein Vir5 n=1 Tax=Plasmodium vivax Mauritania I TaxID=1035515 RepID=A0A0J9TAB8_PLAVI|nr:variable surface protein Vir5 [Plasmodium vivax Mauritania I]